MLPYRGLHRAATMSIGSIWFNGASILRASARCHNANTAMIWCDKLSLLFSHGLHSIQLFLREQPVELGSLLLCPALMCCAVLCCAVPCPFVLCCAVLCCAVLCCAVLCTNTVTSLNQERVVPCCRQCDAVHAAGVLCCAVLCCVVLCCAMPCHAMLRANTAISEV